MRWLGPTLALLWLGCFDPVTPIGLGCSESDSCPPGQSCIDSTCIELACSDLCGDVDQDGDVDRDDNEVLDDINDGQLEAEPCARVFGDLNGNRELDRDDETALDLVLDQLAVSSCALCDSSCADLDGNGSIDGADQDLLAGLLMSSSLPTVCEFVAGDIDGSRSLDEADLQLFPALIEDKANDPCNRCTQRCGDVNPNNRVELLDVSEAGDIAQGLVTPSLCEFAAADVNADGEVDARDVGIIDAIARDEVSRECGQCTGVCGDFDQDGDVDQDDADALRLELSSPGDPAPCAFDAGDVDGDLQLESEDATAIEDGDPLVCE